MAETAPIIDMDRYAGVFLEFQKRTTQYEGMSRIARRVIEENGYSKNPIRMLSIGAGRGTLEKEMIQELDLNLEHICVIEPNPPMFHEISTMLKNLDVCYEGVLSGFDENFKFADEKKEKFDLIMFSHSLYCYEDPLAVIQHAATFLKAGGKMLLIVMRAGHTLVDAQVYLDSMVSDASFLSDAIENNSLTTENVLALLKDAPLQLSMPVMDEPVHDDVDDFIRKINDPACYDVITFYLNSDYTKLSEMLRERIHHIVKKGACLINGKHYVKWMESGIVLAK